MSAIRCFKKILPHQPLYIQLLFTALAFVAMVVLSCLFMSRIVHYEIIQNTESTLGFVAAQINSELQEPRMTLGGFSETARKVIMRNDAGFMQEYINDISNYRDLGALNRSILNGSVLFGYFETIQDKPIFLNNIGWELPDDYMPTERPWYRVAIENGDKIVETPPFIEGIYGNVVFTYVRCILDDEGNRLGVVGLDVRVDEIGKYVVDTVLAKGGYGMLLSEDLEILSHPNVDYVGRNLRDVKSFAHLENDLRNGVDISERPVVSYKNEASIVFFRSLPNGWHLGFVAPKGPYYKSVNNMEITLGVLGAILAVTLMLVLIRVDAARKKSDRESKYKSSFLANMSHEIRTPMNAIIGMTTIAKTAVGVERKDYCLAKIGEASNHLLGVINNILDMSKIEANKFELAPMEFNFEKMLQRVVNVMNLRMEEKHQKFRVYIDKNIPQTLIGDDQKLAQVITNLLGNATKFTPEQGTITLDTRFIREESGVCTIEISLSDTGIGISHEQQKRLFGTFEQADSSTARKYGGTGLGLSISKSIVEMMGGKIGIKSEAGKGSTFFFTIQAKRGADSGNLLDSSVNWSNVRIMAVDDDQDILDYFRDIAQRFGIACDTAISGKEALKFLEKKDIHHIYFIDWKMPDMDGIQLAVELKSRTESNPVVIMISAAELSEVSEEAKKAGVDKFLAKPLFPSSIADVISESLAQGQRQQVKTEQAKMSGLFEGRHILLAEDVEINREIVLTLLESSGLEIDCAENGAEAVRMFTEAPRKYDMIFMDVQMPEMDGYEATRQIRVLEAEERRKTTSLEFPKETPQRVSERPQSVPIIAMTANVFREDIEQCLEAGMTSHIGKPLDMEELFRILRKYLVNTGT